MKHINKEFLPDKFKNPDNSFSPIYGWFWNGPVTKEKTEEQILEMQRLGIKAFYIAPEPKTFRPITMPTLLEPDYLTDAFFEELRYAIDKAHELGMECWIYDEGGWPSGGACGKVMIEHPECARKTLARISFLLPAGESYKKSRSNISAAFINGDEMINEGKSFASDVQVDEYFSEALAWKNPGVPDLPDLTERNSTKYFIEMTHEKYKNALGDYFGNVITAVFTDEPCAPFMPFRSELCEMYEAEFGESILPYLPAIYDVKYVNEKSIIHRRRWYDLCSRVFRDNFLIPCRDWCNENNLKFTGHLDCDNTLGGCMNGRNFHIMRGLRSMDIPGVDVIWRQIFPGQPKKFDADSSCVFSENKFFPRYASSAAAQNGGDVAMTESFGVYGNGLTFDQMRYVTGFQAIRGVTLLNPLMVSYARHGHLMTGELPSFAEKQASHGDLAVFNSYAERLSYVLTRGNRECSVALYYPINDVWGGTRVKEISDEYDELGFAMEACGIDFDIVDDDVILQSQNIDKGIISMGNAAYSEIAIPKSAYLPEKTKEMLDRFVKGGGKIHYSADTVSKNVQIISGNGKIITMKRKTENGDIVALFNQDENEATVTLKVGNAHAYLIDITNGRILNLESPKGECTLELQSGETSAIYLTESSLDAENEASYKSETRLDNFKIRRTNSFVIGEMNFENYDIEEDSVPVKLGDWSEIVGCDFSGSCVYSTSFLGVNNDAILELGDVKYDAEVILNGKSLGVKIMKPYRFEIPKELMRAENTLEIRVTNTPGNQYHYTKSFDKWQPWQLTPYVEKENIFDNDTLASGLYGPVILKY